MGLYWVPGLDGLAAEFKKGWNPSWLYALEFCDLREEEMAAARQFPKNIRRQLFPSTLSSTIPRQYSWPSLTFSIFALNMTLALSWMPETAPSLTFSVKPDWAALLRDLETTNKQLNEIFLR